MSEPYTLDADLYPDISNIVTEDDTSKHDFPSDIDLSPDISHIITEDDTPVDNFASVRQGWECYPYWDRACRTGASTCRTGITVRAGTPKGRTVGRAVADFGY